MNNNIKVLSLTFICCLSSCSPSLSNLKISREGGRFTDVQMAYLTREDVSETTPYNGDLSVSAPNPIKLTWSGKNTVFNVNVYKNPDCEPGSYVTTYRTGANSFDFYNDELNQPYYFFISSLTDPSLKTEVVKYEPEALTVPSPRSLYVEGVENIRDLGGWGKIVDGVYTPYMKQGMIYRSGRFNEDKADPVKVTVTSDGLYELKHHLRIKTEIDLRRSSTNEIGSLTSSPLGEDVNYYNLPMYYGGNNILTFKGTASKDDYQYNNPAKIKEFFDILAVRDNYPIDFHCSIGKDRTGCMAYLIEGLLGFDQEIMYRDYMFTNYSQAGMCKLKDDIKDRYGKTLDSYEGETLQEKVYNYLNNVIGVSKENLDTIINILKA